MPEPIDTLVYVARLSQSEDATLRSLDAAFPGSRLRQSQLAAVPDVCLDRLVRAEGCLEVARSLLANPNNEEHLRTAVGRAYYSIHHSIRVMALWHNNWDPDGHDGSIQQLKELLKDNNFRHNTGLVIDVWQRVNEAKDNRHVADYSPYNLHRDLKDRNVFAISGWDWLTAANFNVELAEEIVAAASKFIGL